MPVPNDVELRVARQLPRTSTRNGRDSSPEAVDRRHDHRHKD